jgi:transmembrane sensor
MGKSETIKPELLVRYLCGECDADEVGKVDRWRNLSHVNEKYFNDYKQIWESEYHALLSSDVLASDWKQIRSRINFGKEHHRLGGWHYFQRVAAIFVLMLGVSGALYTYWNVPGFGRWTAFETGDYIDSLELPDNSVVFLNNHSSVKYLKRFDNGKRTVSLRGEGFFDVTHDQFNPFHVKTPEGVDVEVLGTSFHLEAGRGIENLVLNVTEGVVAIGYRGTSDRIKAGHTARIDDRKFAIMPFVDTNFLSWKTGELIFSQSSLSSIAHGLREHFSEIQRVKLNAQSEILVTTTFRNQSISEVLEELGIHFDKKFQLNEGVLTISD